MHNALRWFRGLSPIQADALLAVVLAIVFGVATVPVPYHGGGYRHADALAVILAVLSALALAYRRRAPLRAWAASLAPMLVFLARGYQGGGALLAPLIAVYTLATLESRRRSLAIAVVTAVLMIAAREAFGPESVGTLALDATGFIGAALFLGWAEAARRAYLSELRGRAQRAERLRIARELHDAVAHGIATINVQAGAAERVIDRQPEQAAAALSVIRQTSKQALAELREILGVLRQEDDSQAAGEPPAPAAGLAELDALLESARRSGVEVRLAVEGRRPPLPAAVDLAAYRIVQESLTNVARHAGACSAKLAIGYSRDALTLNVTDEGTGEQTFSDGTGHGIAGMQERARALGGTVHAGPRPGGGYEVRASLPLQDEPAA